MLDPNPHRLVATLPLLLLALTLTACESEEAGKATTWKRLVDSHCYGLETRALPRAKETTALVERLREAADETGPGPEPAEAGDAEADDAGADDAEAKEADAEPTDTEAISREAQRRVDCLEARAGLNRQLGRLAVSEDHAEALRHAAAFHPSFATAIETDLGREDTVVVLRSLDCASPSAEDLSRYAEIIESGQREVEKRLNEAVAACHNIR